MTDSVEAQVARARNEFLEMVEGIRPELHRYCARLTGSVIEGEDIVQETLARAFYSLSLNPHTPPLRPWLFKIAHNAAIDFLKRHGRKYTESRADMTDVADYEDAADPMVVRAALLCFVALPVSQRSAVILKDVLGHSLEETAETMGTSVMAVKASLVRGRKKLEAAAAADVIAEASQRAALERYAALFNAKDWDGLRAMIGEDCRLDLVSKSQRRGKEVGMYFGRYAQEQVTVRPVRLEGELALAAFEAGARAPSYFILLSFQDDRVAFIRDYRYVPYIASELDLVDLDPLDPDPGDGGQSLGG
ncbi:MAG: sigma-70 family RNA polymerase sigma factor [Sandaracinaceae bacterium]